MSSPTVTPQVEAITRQLQAARTDLAAARALWSRQPTTGTVQHEQTCQWRLDRLLDRLWAAMTPAQQAAADHRPVRGR